jgi:hypothetical protein
LREFVLHAPPHLLLAGQKIGSSTRLLQPAGHALPRPTRSSAAIQSQGYLRAAELLGVGPLERVVVEDADPGVAASRT